MLKRINPMMLIILALMLVMNFLDGDFDNPKEWLRSMIVMLPGIIVGLSMHEFSHGIVSYRLGDPTPKVQGRVTVNPLAHIDPLGVIALLFCGFGWGVPVEINPSYYRHRRRDEFFVSIAGVAMNLLIAVLSAVILRFILYSQAAETVTGGILVDIFVQMAVINLVLMIFNLIPVPPLDGFGILTQIFNLRKYSWYDVLYNNGMWILLALIIFNVTGMIISPAVNSIWNILVNAIIY